jgi:hypothetical protein
VLMDPVRQQALADAAGRLAALRYNSAVYMDQLATLLGAMKHRNGDGHG